MNPPRKTARNPRMILRRRGNREPSEEDDAIDEQETTDGNPDDEADSRETGSNEEAKQSGSTITSLLPPRKTINGHTTALQNTVMR